jgi:peptide deformylase
MSFVLELRKYPDPVLTQESLVVEEIDEAVKRLVGRMFDVMLEASGQGLAAPQVGVLQRVIIMRVDNMDYAVVNPEITFAEGEEKDEEGCLSIPGVGIEVPRATSLLLQGFDPDGKPIKLEAKGILARVAQHEVDHLNGRLIIDYLSKAERLDFELNYIRTMSSLRGQA